MRIIQEINELSNKLKNTNNIVCNVTRTPPIILNKNTHDYKYFLDYIVEYADEIQLNDIIYEGIHKSYPRADLKVKLETKLQLAIFDDSYDSNNILISLTYHNLNIWKELIQIIQQYGWFISTIDIIDKDDNEQTFNGNDLSIIDKLIKSKFTSAVITVESRKTPEGKQAIPYTVTPKILYHATVLPVWNNIKQYGLSPKTKSILSFHPDRIYFTEDVNSAIMIARELAWNRLNAAKQQTHDISKFNPEKYYKTWAILKIDTDKIPHVSKKQYSYFRVHKDPNAIEFNGLYSVNYIPPSAITLVKTVNAY